MKISQPFWWLSNKLTPWRLVPLRSACVFAYEVSQYQRTPWAPFAESICWPMHEKTINLGEDRAGGIVVYFAYALEMMDCSIYGTPRKGQSVSERREKIPSWKLIGGMFTQDFSEFHRFQQNGFLEVWECPMMRVRDVMAAIDRMTTQGRTMSWQ
jgi:hypothetical protein